MAYVDLEYVCAVSPIRADAARNYEAANPGSFLQIATSISRVFDARLHKRYATPFDPVDPPEAIKYNVGNVVAFQLLMKIGYDPGSEQDVLVKDLRDESLAWLKDAADSVAGTVELPARETQPVGDGTAISRSRPLAYSESTPYTWTRRQAERARARGER